MMKQIVLMLLFLISYNQVKSDIKTIYKPQLNGFIQLGPFLNGSNVTIYELNKFFGTTGINYNTQVLNNKGAFKLKEVTLQTAISQFKADGFYYNQIAGKNSSAPLTLYALADVSKVDTVNINVLTHLEKNRIVYLIETGKTFEEAKRIAQKEILTLFGIDKPDIKLSEELDITKSDDDNAILLAISVIAMGYRDVADLSELLANISDDMREDGVLNNQRLGSALYSGIVFRDLAKVRNNLVERYAALGLNIKIGDFEKYVRQFINTSPYPYISNITYPKNGVYGVNALNDSLEVAVAARFYSIAAEVPYESSVKIVLTKANWTFVLGENDWINNKDYNAKYWRLESSGIGFYDAQMYFYPDECTLVEIYENGSPNPVRTKTICSYKAVSINDYSMGEVEFYPNPVSDKLTIKLKSVTAGKTNIDIYNALGELMGNYTFNAQNEYEIPTGDLKSGLYFARIHTDDKVPLTIKFMK